MIGKRHLGQRGRHGQREMRGQRVGAEVLEARQLLAATTPDTAGTDFWFLFQFNSGINAVQTNTVLITSKTQAQVSVKEYGTGKQADFTLSPDEMLVYTLPEGSATPWQMEGTTNSAVHVTSDQDVTVYALNHFDCTTDGLTALPVDMLGTAYMVVSYPGFSQYAVIATEDDTTVTISPTQDAGTHAAGVPYQVRLDRGQVYQVTYGVADGFDMPLDDLTGTTITADKPIAAFSGDKVAYVPHDKVAGDHLIEQLMPIDQWGRHFVTVPLGGRMAGDTFRVLASEDDTAVRINGVLKATLNRGEYYEWLTSSAQGVDASHPVSLMQFASSMNLDLDAGYSDVLGDPFMTTVPPVDEGLTHYALATAPEGLPTKQSGFVSHYISIWAPKGTAITLDGQMLPESTFTDIGQSGYMGASIKVDPGTHILDGNASFGAMIYGWNWYDSYCFTGGWTLESRWPADFELYVPVADAEVAQAYPIGVVLLNDKGYPLAGMPVDFTISGVNAHHGTAITDAQGYASFTYTGGNPGLDTITISSSLARAHGATTMVAWHSVPVAAGASYTTDSGAPVAGAVSATTADGHALSYRLATQATHGYVLLRPDGQFTYVSEVPYFGPDSFSFIASDGGIDSDPATIQFDVLRANHLPQPADASFTVSQYTPVGTILGTVPATDPDGDTLSYAITAGNDQARFAVDPATGELTLAAPLDYQSQSSYQLTIAVTDSGTPALSKTATVHITVTDVPLPLPLTITGTEEANHITVNAGDGQYIITIDESVSYAAMDSVSAIIINALGGDDAIHIGPGVIACRIRAGAGNDTIRGGAGNDTIYGDEGDDLIYGNDGDDSLTGNFGNDTIYGGAGRNSLMGALGADLLVGGADQDSIYGGDQPDWIYGNEGDDYIEGRGKADTINGGAGNDTIWGGAGADLIYGEDGDDWVDLGYWSFADTLYGGDGSDISSHDSNDTNDQLYEIDSLLA